MAEKPTSRRAGRLHSRLPIQKSRVSLMVVSVRRALPSLWYCLIRVCLYSTCRLGVTPWVRTRVRNRPWVPMTAAVVDPPVEDQRDPVGAAHVQVLADDCLEEHPARGGPVQHLGQGELGLQDRNVVAVAGPAVRGGEGVGQDLQPLTQQSVDAGRVETVTDALQAGRVVTRGEPVVEGLEADPGLGRLAFGPLVAVDAQLGVVGEVGAELDEERPEVGVEGVHVEVVDHGGGLDDPRVGGPGGRVATLLGAEHRAPSPAPAR